MNERNYDAFIGSTKTNKASRTHPSRHNPRWKEAIDGLRNGNEVVSRRVFAGKLNVKNISIGTEVVGEGDDIRNVSSIEIRVEKLN
jgi:hypothetical protein